MKILITSDLAGHRKWYGWLREAGKRFDGVVVAGNHLRSVEQTERAEEKTMVEQCVESLEALGVSVWIGQSAEDQGWPWLERRLGLRVGGGMIVFARPFTLTSPLLLEAWSDGRAKAREFRLPFSVITYQAPELELTSSFLSKADEPIARSREPLVEFCFCGLFPPTRLGEHESAHWFRRRDPIIALRPGCDVSSYLPRHIVLDLDSQDAIHFSEQGLHRIILNQAEPSA